MEYFPLGLHISLLYRAQRSFFTNETKLFDIGGGQVTFVFFLSANPGSSQDDIAKNLELDKTTVTRAVSKLEKCGIVMRERDSKDNRVIRLYLTDKGKQVHEELKGVKQAWYGKLIEGMTQEDVNELKRLMTIMSENARTFKSECNLDKEKKVENETE